MALVWSRWSTTSATVQPGQGVGRAQPSSSSGSSRLDSSACCSVRATTMESTASLRDRHQTGTSMSARRTFVIALVAALVVAACSGSGGGEGAASSSSTSPTSAYPLDDTLRLNDLQVIGTHNSYHVQADDKLFNAIKAFDASTAV